jgi:O-antigen/teichoic acid export membrane protein
VGTGWAFAWALALGPAANLYFRVPKQRRPQLSGQRGTASGRFLAAYIAGSLASQALLAGGPLVVVLLGGDATAVSVLFVTFTLFRAPLTLLYAMQARLLPVLVGQHLAGAGGRLVGFVRKVGVAAALLCPVGLVAGYLLGPGIIGFLYGPAFTPGPFIAAAIAGGVVLATAAHLAGQALVAAGRTAALASAWSSGLVVALLVLPMPAGAAMSRTALAFFAGEFVAFVLIIALGGRHRPDAHADDMVGSQGDADSGAGPRWIVSRLKRGDST